MRIFFAACQFWRRFVQSAGAVGEAGAAAAARMEAQTIYFQLTKLFRSYEISLVLIQTLNLVRVEIARKSYVECVPWIPLWVDISLVVKRMTLSLVKVAPVIIFTNVLVQFSKTVLPIFGYFV